MSEVTKSTEAAAVAEIVRANQQPILKDDTNNILVLPNGQVLNLERYQANPRRKRARVYFYEVASFIDYVSQFKGSFTTQLFGEANETGGKFNAVLDWHSNLVNDVANWGEHTAGLVLSASPEWVRWMGKNNKPLSQLEFAEFIEDNALDIISPAGADLLDIIANLEGKKDVAFKSVRNLRNGSVQLGYTEIVEATGGKRDDALSLPDKFVIGITPFVSAMGIEITARLRFRVGDNGKITFT